ncbi:MAG TPA: oligosaccharide flippase family protein [Microbacteriaceae bacterium]|jgi:O-antigen/teichoic acid export membrane protein|nr:oligosaccharide flippase family protein [Microbacteriaceae bacterium]
MTVQDPAAAPVGTTAAGQPPSLGRVVRDIAVYGSGDLLLRGATIITLPIYTRYLVPQDYGAMSLVISLSSFATGFLILGVDIAYARYYFETREHESRRLLTTSALTFVALWGCGVTAVCLPFVGFFSEWAFGSSNRSTLFTITLIAAPLTLLNQLLAQILRNEFRPTLFSILSGLTSAITISTSLIAVTVFDLGVKGILLGVAVGAGALLPVRLWLARAYLVRRLEMRIVRKLLGFGLPLVPTAVAWWVFDLSDRIIVGRAAGLRELGLYTVAVSLASTLALFTSALGQAWSPHAFKIYEEAPALAATFFGRAFTLILVGFGVLCVALTAFARPLLMLLSTPPFYDAARAVGPLALGFVAWATIQVTASGISLTKKTGYFAAYSWLAAGCNVGLNLLFVPRFGMLAAAWSTFVAYFLLTVAYMATSQRLWRVHYERRRAASAAILIVLFTAAYQYLPHFQLAPALALALGWCILFVVAIAALNVIDPRTLRPVMSRLTRGRRISERHST